MNQKTTTLLARIYRDFMRPYMGQVGLAGIFMLIAALLTAGVAQMFQPVLDIVMTAGHPEYVFPIAGGLGLIFILRGVVSYIHTIMMNKVSQSIVADIQRSLFNHFMYLDLSFFHAHPSGQLTSRIINDVTVMRMAITDTLTGFVKSTLTLVFLVGLMFYQDITLAMFAVFVFPFASIFVAKLGKRLRKIASSTQEELGNLSAQLAQVFAGMRQVMAYNAQDFEAQKAANSINNVRHLMVKGLRVGTLAMPVNEMLVGITVFAIIVYGGYQVNAGEMTTGQLGSFIAAFVLAYEPMKKLAKLNNNLQNGLGAAERVFAMLEVKSDIAGRDNAARGAACQIDSAPLIEFKDVSFSYDKAAASQGQDRALNKISLRLEPSKVTALVGMSGGGKSTVLNLIPRFYDVDDGAIMINGTDIRDLDLMSLRNHIALVSQDITIFDDSVLANIAYGHDNIDEKAVIEAAKLAAADEFITQMPQGYATRLGENGVKLSGGQKQRISIARAILKSAPILLLDEATSALDNESERLIQNSLKELQKGRTTLVIAHRLSTIEDADHIYVLDKGQVAEQGIHASLITQNGIYTQMNRDHAQLRSDVAG